MYKILFAGTLDSMPYPIVRSYCDLKLGRIPIQKSEIEIHAFGRAKVRKVIERYSFDSGYHCIYHEPEWHALGKSAGYRLIENLVKDANALILSDRGKTPMLNYMLEKATEWCLELYIFNPEHPEL